MAGEVSFQDVEELSVIRGIYRKIGQDIPEILVRRSRKKEKNKRLNIAGKREAFQNGGKCGDCLLNAIVAHSGGYGLKALLPDADVKYAIPAASLVEHSPNVPHDLAPHMPITPEWTQTSFALGDVLAGTNPSDPEAEVDLRQWALRLIARYQFVDSSTNALFSM